MKKIFTLLVLLVATTALWAEDFKVDGIYYNILSNNEVEVTYRGWDYDYYNEYSGSVTIPSTVTYNGTTYSVTSIGELAFWACSGLTSVTIPNSVTSIGNWAFGECTGLTSITIPNSVTSIGDQAFYYCSSLTSITIPNSVTSIGVGAFEGCSSLPVENNLRYADTYLVEAVDRTLSTYSIKEGTKWIGDYAFSDCSGLTSITIPNSVTSIGESAFRYCSGLTSVIWNAENCADFSSYSPFYDISSQIPSFIFGDNVKHIPAYLCDGMSKLTSITIPNSVTSIGRSAFSDCSSLTSVVWNAENCADFSDSSYAPFYDIRSQITSFTFGEDVQRIPAYLCYEMSKLTSITIPNSVTSIGGYAFYDCSSLTSVTIGNSVTSIGGYAFAYCSSLTSITIPNSVTSIGGYAFAYCSSLTSITIPNSVTSIGDWAFNYCTDLTSVTIPNSVTSIGEGAFYWCSGLTSVTIPNSVTSIGYMAFYNCSGLTSVTIGNSVTSIGDFAFYGCSDLTSVTIPNSVTSIGNYAFSSCSGLTSIIVEEGNSIYDSRENCNAIIETNSNTLVAGCKNTTIPNSVTSIGDRAFYYCSGLTSVTIGNSVKSIGDYAFDGCSGLTSVTLFAETPPTLGGNVFPNATRSIPIYVPCGKVKTYNATDGWNSLSNIQEPLAEHSIAVGVNDNKIGTTKVYKNTICGAQISATPNFGYHFVQWSDGNTDNPRTLVLTQDTVLTAEFALTCSGQCGDNLYWQYAGTTFAITGTGNMWKDIPWRLFCDSITTVDIANGATSISESAFANCKKLTKVILPASMEEVGANAFANCARLYDIYSYATLPPLAELSSFVNYNADVHVICEAKDYYKKDMTWGEFANIVCVSSDKVSTDDIVINPGSTDVTITWPTDPNAETYVIVIKQGDKVFCTLTFNADGMLLNIAFAPSRSGSHPVTYAASTGNGLRFTVTSLDAATTYAYDITTKDVDDNTISTYTGEFTTKSNVSTSVSDIQSPMTNCQKLLRNGQLIILRDGMEYNAQGQIIKE